MPSTNIIESVVGVLSLGFTSNISNLMTGVNGVMEGFDCLLSGHTRYYTNIGV